MPFNQSNILLVSEKLFENIEIIIIIMLNVKLIKFKIYCVLIITKKGNILNTWLGFAYVENPLFLFCVGSSR